MHCRYVNYNHPLPYTTKRKYLGHIINNNLTDDDDIDIARQKRGLYAQVLARKFCLCNISTKITLFQAYCAPMYTSSLWCKLKKYSLKSITVAYNNSLRILLHLRSRCNASFMFATNYIKSFNERIRSSIFSRIIFFLLITYILIFIIRAVCTHTGGRYYTHDIRIIFCLITFLVCIFTTYLINFNFTLIYLRRSHHCFDFIICIVLFIFLIVILCIYMDDVLSEIQLYINPSN